MIPSPACRTLVMSFEGCVLKAYPDPATHSDPYTVGYGHVGPDVHRDTYWTLKQAQDQLDIDLGKFAAGVTSLLDGAPTSQPQFDSLVAFAYNLGLGALSRSTLLKKHKAGDYAGARAEFTKWSSAAGSVMRGLMRRRQAEADLYGSEA